MLCSEILRSVSGKLQDEDEGARRWPWESASGAYSLMDSLNAAVREIVMQRPDATARTEPMRLEPGMMQRIPRADIHMTSRNAVSLINVIQNLAPDGNTPGRPVFRVELDALRAAMTPETILVSVMFVNNEIGSVQPIEEISKIVKMVNPQALLHVDAVQAYGKYRIYPKRMGIDMLSVSGHKIHGPKGSGFLYIDEKVKIRPLILGGGQQNGMRSGTDNVPGIAGLAKSAEIVYKHFDEQTAQMRACKHRLIEGLRELDDVVIHGMPEEEGAPQIVNASFLNVRSEVLLHTMEDRQIYVSAGSACSSHKRAGSPTLTAIGASKAEMESAVRFSFSEFTTLEQIDYTLDTLREVLPMLRRFTRK